MSDLKINIRPAHISDLKEMQTLFAETIAATCKKDYTQEQISVWTSSIENRQRWTDKLEKQYFLIAESENKIVGYASLENGDYLDFLYVHKDFQREGIAGKLYAQIETEAIKRGATLLTSDVSITARPFFEKKGFKALATQTNKIQGVEIINYKMIKEM